MDEINEQIGNEDHIFEKRPGTTDEGKNYEDIVIALLTLRLIKDDQIKDFQLSSNNKHFGDFDDIVLEILYKNGDKREYGMQLKHQQSKKRKITKDKLAGPKGDFSIQKYFESFRKVNKENFHYIIYTNALFETCHNFKMKDKEYIKIATQKYHFTDIEDGLLDTSESEYYKFDITSCEETDEELEEYKKFLQHFFLFPNQKNCAKTENLALELFKKTFSSGETSFKLYKEFISGWSKLDRKKECLNKDVVKFKIAEILLKPYTKMIPFSQSKTPNYIRDLCFLFDIIIAHKTNDIRIKMSEIFGGIAKGKDEDILKIGKQFYIVSDDIKFLEYLSEEKVTLILWHMNEIPFIIEMEENEENVIYQAIRLCNQDCSTKRRFVLIGENIKINQLETNKVFKNLSDLSFDSEVYKKLSTNLKVSLQGRDPRSLQYLLNVSEEMGKVITINKLIEMINSPLKVGEDKEELPSIYIDQYLPRNLIDFKFINENCDESLSVVSCVQKPEIFGIKPITVDSYLQDSNSKEEHQNNKTFDKIVIISEKQCSDEDFYKICGKNPRKICHHFRITSNNNLEWITSNGNIEMLGKYLFTKPQSDFIHIQKSEIFNAVNNKINLICAKPGMGKSVLTKYLKNLYPSYYWIINMNFREHFMFLKDNHGAQDILKYLQDFQNQKNQYNTFDVEVRKAFEVKKKIVIIWDALDEFPPFHVISAIQAIEELSSYGFTQWITARNYLQPMLESKFNVFSWTIKDIDKNQQELYVRKRLQSQQYDEGELKEIVEKIINIVTINEDRDFLGVPMHLSILTELFFQNSKKYRKLITKNFILVDTIYFAIKKKLIFVLKIKAIVT